MVHAGVRVCVWACGCSAALLAYVSVWLRLWVSCCALVCVCARVVDVGRMIDARMSMSVCALGGVHVRFALL